MDMRFWRSSLLAASTDPLSPASQEGGSPSSYAMSAMKHLETAMDTIVSAAMTPLVNLKSALTSSEDPTLSWYAAIILIVLAACAMLAILNRYKKSLKSFFRKNYRKVYNRVENDDDEYCLSDSEDDDDEDDDEEDEESDDSDYSRGRGDRSSKKHYRSKNTSRPSRTRQKRRH